MNVTFTLAWWHLVAGTAALFLLMLSIAAMANGTQPVADHSREDRMPAWLVALLYIGMIAFDVFVIGGAAWLIIFKDGSAWWAFFALLLASSSSPKGLIRAWYRMPDPKE